MRGINTILLLLAVVSSCIGNKNNPEEIAKLAIESRYKCDPSIAKQIATLDTIYNKQVDFDNNYISYYKSLKDSVYNFISSEQIKSSVIPPGYRLYKIKFTWGYSSDTLERVMTVQMISNKWRACIVDPAIWSNISILESKMDDLVTINSEYKKILDIDPFNLYALERLTSNNVRLENFQTAMAFAKEWYSVDSSANALFHIAFSEKDPLISIALYKKLLSQQWYDAASSNIALNYNYLGICDSSIHYSNLVKDSIIKYYSLWDVYNNSKNCRNIKLSKQNAIKYSNYLISNWNHIVKRDPILYRARLRSMIDFWKYFDDKRVSELVGLVLLTNPDDEEFRQYKDLLE